MDKWNESDFINIHENIINPAEKQIISDALCHAYTIQAWNKNYY